MHKPDNARSELMSKQGWKALIRNPIEAYDVSDKATQSQAEVAEWQTRRTQEPSYQRKQRMAQPLNLLPITEKSPSKNLSLC
jgi:hypothetical protein